MSLGAHFNVTTHSFDGRGLLKDKHFPPAKLILICICGGCCAISLRQLASRHSKALIIFQLKSLVSKSAYDDEKCKWQLDQTGWLIGQLDQRGSGEETAAAGSSLGSLFPALCFTEASPFFFFNSRS